MIYREAILFHQIQLLQAEVNFLNSRPVSGNSGNSGGFIPVEFTGASDEVGWQQLGIFAFNNAPSLIGITELVYNISTNREGIDIENASDLTSISFPNLETITDGSYFLITSCAALTEANFPSLTATEGTFQLDSNASLTTITLPVYSICGNDFKITGNTALETLSLPELVSVDDILELSGLTSLTSLSIPILSSINRFTFTTNVALTSLTLSALTSINSGSNVSISLSGCTLLQTINLSALVTIGADVSIINNPALTSINLASWLPTNGTTIDFTGNILLASSVNQILARAVASGMTSGSIDLSGGTNAAPTGQGITDAAALTIAGVVVTTN